MSDQRVVLEKYLKIGDEIIMNMPVDARSYGRKGVPDGTKGIVIGFNRYKRAYGYTDQWIKPAGIYEGNGAACVKWENAGSDIVSAGDVSFQDNNLYNERHNDAQYHNAFETLAFISELPELPYMEGDKIKLHRSRFGDTDEVIICLIDYLKAKDYCIDNITPYPIYTISPINNPGVTTNVNHSDIKSLIERGNYWAWKNDKSKLKFSNLKEEASFYFSLGLAVSVKNPANNLYVWSMEEAFNSVSIGYGDVISVKSGLFGSGPYISVYKIIDNPELSIRLQNETIKGFSMS